MHHLATGQMRYETTSRLERLNQEFRGGSRWALCGRPKTCCRCSKTGGLINNNTYTQIHRWDTVLPIKRGIRVRGSATVRP